MGRCAAHEKLLSDTQNALVTTRDVDFCLPSFPSRPRASRTKRETRVWVDAVADGEEKTKREFVIFSLGCTWGRMIVRNLRATNSMKIQVCAGMAPRFRYETLTQDRY
jgi:hypothetical protein